MLKKIFFLSLFLISTPLVCAPHDPSVEEKTTVGTEPSTTRFTNFMSSTSGNYILFLLVKYIPSSIWHRVFNLTDDDLKKWAQMLLIEYFNEDALKKASDEILKITDEALKDVGVTNEVIVLESAGSNPSKAVEGPNDVSFIILQATHPLGEEDKQLVTHAAYHEAAHVYNHDIHNEHLLLFQSILSVCVAPAYPFYLAWNRGLGLKNWFYHYLYITLFSLIVYLRFSLTTFKQHTEKTADLVACDRMAKSGKYDAIIAGIGKHIDDTLNLDAQAVSEFSPEITGIWWQITSFFNWLLSPITHPAPAERARYLTQCLRENGGNIDSDKLVEIITAQKTAPYHPETRKIILAFLFIHWSSLDQEDPSREYRHLHIIHEYNALRRLENVSLASSFDQVDASWLASALKKVSHTLESKKT